MWQNKFVVVGVTGGIAAYKAADLVSKLVKQGAEVQVIMTASAQRFITPLTLQTLSRNAVITDMFAEVRTWEVQHIALADRADMFLVVPATANVIGKVANGIADDMLSTTIMATRAPVVFAPAMNLNMYANPIVQSNITRLTELGYHFVEPASGRLACGYEGKGRLPEVETILQQAEQILAQQAGHASEAGGYEQGQKPGHEPGHEPQAGSAALRGRTVLVTAGATQEAIDPVRYITNHSSGKMGFAIAANAAARGAKVILVSGPSSLPDPEGVEVIRIKSAREMFAEVTHLFPTADVVIKAAAVADYRPKEAARQKIKKADGDLVLQLERNPDILAWLGAHKSGQILVGFAAETNDLLANATTKLLKKQLDFIVANDLTEAGAGFGSDTNVVKLVFPDGRVCPLPLMGKDQVAAAVLDQVELLL